MDARIDLDAAAVEIDRRRTGWGSVGVDAGPTTWRDQSRGWPPTITPDRGAAPEPDSIGVTFRKDSQEAELVLYAGGWADVIFWSGDAADPYQRVEGWDDWLTVERFGVVLDELVRRFR